MTGNDESGEWFNMSSWHAASHHKNMGILYGYNLMNMFMTGDRLFPYPSVNNMVLKQAVLKKHKGCINTDTDIEYKSNTMLIYLKKKSSDTDT